ncbi:MAG: type II toxin-antitoxin system RelB/DinJ family antitoxin [Clostridiales Family XIII bacterium]|nr:type II toxin-antitoxin system RelB/DinJ family antitoxin [Clostridiales Family XIII bacterium]
MAQATMNVRIDEGVKKSFDEFCAEVGLNASVAVNMFVRAVLRSRSIPFEITDSPADDIGRQLAASSLLDILTERVKEGENMENWVDYDTAIRDMRTQIAAGRTR